MRLSKKYKNKKIPLNKYLNKIGYCENRYLEGLNNKKGGHYVFIRELNRNGTFNVNTVTSLENKKGKIDYSKIKSVKKGQIYPIPKNHANFSRWSGIDSRTKRNVKSKNIKCIGKKQIKRRHLFYLGKFMK